MQRMGHSGITTHGFRSCFVDWSSECTGFSYEVREMCLGHSVGDMTERSYRRTDMLQWRGTLMLAWADFLAGD